MGTPENAKAISESMDGVIFLSSSLQHQEGAMHEEADSLCHQLCRQYWVDQRRTGHRTTFSQGNRGPESVAGYLLE